MPSVTLRAAAETDIDFICRLIETTMRVYMEQTWGSFDERNVRQHTTESITVNEYAIIRCEGQDIGALAVKCDDATHIHLDQLFILPSHQNRGIGTELVRGLVREAREARKPLRLRVLA